MKLSKHGQQRLRERNGKMSKRRQYFEVNLAYKRGLDFKNFYKSKFRLFLVQRTKHNHNKIAKVYNDKIYIFDRIHKKLVTMFEIPDEYKDYKNFVIK